MNQLTLLFSWRGWMYPLTRFLYRHLILPFRRVEIRGQSLLPTVRRPMVFYSNHRSEHDPWLIASCSRRPIAWMAKKELYSISTLRELYRKERETFEGQARFPRLAQLLSGIIARATVFIVSHAYTIPVDRTQTEAALNQEAMRRASDILREGGVVGVFYQGGIGRDEVYRGAIVLARKHRAILVPVALGERRITFLPPVDFAERSAENTRLRAIELDGLIRAAL